MKVRERRADQTWQKFCSVSSGLDVDDDEEDMGLELVNRRVDEQMKFPSILAPSRLYES